MNANVEMEKKALCVGEILSCGNLKLAVAESCTGGLLGGHITAVAGASKYFRGAVIAYHNDVKRDILGVSSSDLNAHGAVSDVVARAMAVGAAKLFGCDCAISVTGIAGPDGGTDEKPVGLVFIGVFFRGAVLSRSFVFSGARHEVREQSVISALDFLIETIRS